VENIGGTLVFFGYQDEVIDVTPAISAQPSLKTRILKDQ
jgi:hypothetical protein